MPKDFQDPTVHRFIELHDNESARRPLRWWQILWYLLLISGLIVFVLWRWDFFLIGVNLLIAGFYFLVILFKLVVVFVSIVRPREIKISKRKIALLTDEELPVYTILIPLYKESNVAEKILKHLRKLDYPQSKLDIKLLLESDDKATQVACRMLDLPPCFETVIVPDARPKTKPRACNHGLDKARGEYLVIYDAEDRPEPDQLKKAVAAFRRLPDDVVCIQSKLNYYNPRHNLLTKWFTVEYTVWFDFFLPGLHSLGVPIPLGGTSNHFKTPELQKIGGWDPFNVTEDCDLGIRLARRDMRTVVLDSTTWEEANSRPYNWIRQRSRWIKGYIQTHFVHMRNPLRLIRDLGMRGFISFILTVGGLSGMLLLNVIYWLIAGIYISLLMKDLAAGHILSNVIAGPREHPRFAWQMLFVGPNEDPVWSAISVVFFWITGILLLSNILFILLNCMGCLKRRMPDLLVAAFISPVYWLLISIAAWKGLFQFITRPFYWEKTDHGLSDAGS